MVAASKGFYYYVCLLGASTGGAKFLSSVYKGFRMNPVMRIRCCGGWEFMFRSTAGEMHSVSNIKLNLTSLLFQEWCLLSVGFLESALPFERPWITPLASTSYIISFLVFRNLSHTTSKRTKKLQLIGMEGSMKILKKSHIPSFSTTTTGE